MDDLTKFEKYVVTFAKNDKKNGKEVKGKGKSLPSAKKKNPTKQEPENDITFLELLELYFEQHTTLKVIIPTVKDMIDFAMKKEDLEMKRVWMRILEKVERMVMIAVTKNKTDTLPWHVLKKSLQEEKSVMRSLNDICIWDEERENFIISLKKHATMLPSSSAGTKHVMTLPTIASVETERTGVRKLKKFKRDEPSTSSIESGTKDAKEFSQFITRWKDGKLHTIKTSGNIGIGTHLIRIEILPVQAIQDKPEEDWSRYASIRCNFLSRSWIDPLQMQVCRTLDEVEKRLSQQERNVSWTVPDLSSTTSFI